MPPENRRRRVGLYTGSCAGVDLTSTDAGRMPFDLRIRSRLFSAPLGRARGDVPPMCPGGFWPSYRILNRPSKRAKLSVLDTCCQGDGKGKFGCWM